VPEQASILGMAGPIVVLAALLYVLVFEGALRKYQRTLVHIAMVAVLCVVLLHVLFVKTVYDYGTVGQTRRFLVGAWLNSSGRNDWHLMGDPSIEVMIGDHGGLDKIPSWYGWDYPLIIILYVGCYLAFITSTVLVVGVLTSRLPVSSRRGSRRRRSSIGKL
jgi:hypothetical protein